MSALRRGREDAQEPDRASLFEFLRLARLNLRVDRAFHKMQPRTRPAWRSWIGCITVAWKDTHRG